jgi:hypothetical protein
MKTSHFGSLILVILMIAACGSEGPAKGEQRALSEQDPEAAQSLVRASNVSTVQHSHDGSMRPAIDTAKIPPRAEGYATRRVRAERRDTPRQNSDGTGQFRLTCQFSHMSFDDPIVYPRQPGAAHLHVFFGNTAAGHNTTAESIRTVGNSTCTGGTANRTGYWVPAIVDTKDGTPLKPAKMLVYYKSDSTGGDSIQPFPVGLRMISGNMNSTEAQPNTDFGCLGPDGQEARFSHIPRSCPVGWLVEMTINFPMCWDGVNLDSPDHKGHMSFTKWDNAIRRKTCPKSHPVNLPGITEKIQYRVLEDGETSRWRLSSDNYSNDMPGGFSIHADWFNGWDPDIEKTWITNCLKANRDCHGMLLGDGTTLF